ncbi:hypothetical protein BGX27_010180 [Mortierella sp. AM989]|nr:hypothetical protein BGX27_010180 [Mortierella sp. AM989]
MDHLIGQHLSKIDLANCILVNSTFYNQFKPQYWRDIKIHQYDKEFNHTYHEVFLKNGWFIRTLSSLSPCKNLVELLPKRLQYLKLDWAVEEEEEEKEKEEEEEEDDEVDEEGNVEWPKSYPNFEDPRFKTWWWCENYALTLPAEMLGPGGIQSR